MQIHSRIFFVFCCLVFFTGADTALLADGLSFSVSPMISDLTIAPGSTHTGLIAVSDNVPAGTPTVNVKATIKDWTLDNYGHPVYSDPGTTPGSCASWLQLTPIELALKGGPPSLVRYTITVPPDAQGSYHCIVFFTTTPLENFAKGASANICAMIGNTIYVQVGPPVKRAKITDIELTAKTVTVTVENTGSSYVRLGGAVKITDSAGKLLQQVDIPADAVLPGANSTRIVPIDLNSVLASGAYTVTALLDYGGQALLGARINATLP
jgi:hypothetical protein